VQSAWLDHPVSTRPASPVSPRPRTRTPTADSTETLGCPEGEAMSQSLERAKILHTQSRTDQVSGCPVSCLSRQDGYIKEAVTMLRHVIISCHWPVRKIYSRCAS
jgi:hypothetical protein